ncbi:hypothetical protein [Pontibacter ummariensis]|nr:hypothetical protein [Pontibacter ummariensis]
MRNQQHHASPRTPQQAPLNESHINLMQSWLNLRGMDYELLAEQKYLDLNETFKNRKDNSK